MIEFAAICWIVIIVGLLVMVAGVMLNRWEVADLGAHIILVPLPVLVIVVIVGAAIDILK